MTCPKCGCVLVTCPHCQKELGFIVQTIIKSIPHAIQCPNPDCKYVIDILERPVLSKSATTRILIFKHKKS